MNLVHTKESTPKQLRMNYYVKFVGGLGKVCLVKKDTTF